MVRGFGMEIRFFFFESYIGVGDLEKQAGRFTLKPLKGCEFCHIGGFIKYDEGGGEG